MPFRTARHPIQVVVRRTGLSADVIRAWEKRYDVVAPVRSDSGRRLYSDADVARLELLARATLGGHTIGQAAALSAPALAALVRADAATAAHLAAPRTADTPNAQADAATERVAECLDAATRLAPADLDAALRRALLALGATPFIDAVVVPFWSEIGERVRAGTLRPAHQHLVLAILRRALDRLTSAAGAGLTRLGLVVATPLGQHHELGALVATAVAAAEGLRPLYLGVGLSADSIGEIATQLGAPAVLLGLGTAASDRVVPRELRHLRALLPADVAILAEGPAAHAHRGVLREIEAVIIPDAPALRVWLRGRRRA